MLSILRTALSKIRQLLTLSWQFFTGIVVAIVAFSTNFHDFKQPDISVEITAVTTTSSEPIDLVRIAELSGLREMIDGNSLSFRSRIGGNEVGWTPDEIDRQLLILNSQVSSDVSELDQIEKKFTSIAANRSSDQETLLSDLMREISIFTPFNKQTEEGKSDPDKVNGLIKDAGKLLSEKKARQNDFSAKVKEAERQWSNYKANVLPNRARLVVTSAIGNRGAGATSLKPQALFRANLGDGNYLDFPMKLSGYEKSADSSSLQTQVFKVLRFESDEVQSMAPADRERFKSFLGNASPATLFISDVRGRTYSSNTVPFSPGVYEQKVYDSLKQFASRSHQR